MFDEKEKIKETSVTRNKQTTGRVCAIQKRQTQFLLHIIHIQTKRA